MSKKKKKKSWKERQRERQIKQQRAQEAFRIQNGREGKRKSRHWPTGKILVAVCLIALIIGAYLVWQYIKPLEEPPQKSGTIYIRADGSIDPANAPILNVENVYYTLTADINDSIVVERDNIVVSGANYSLQAIGNSTLDGIKMTGRRNVTIASIKIRNFGNGVYLLQSSNNTLNGNSIINNKRDGIRLEQSPTNILSANSITSNQFDGIVLFNSSNSTLSGNNITNNEHDGIHLEFSSDNTLTENRITNNLDDGFHLKNSSNNILSENIITNNINSSIYLNSASHNLLSQNDLTGNKDGIIFELSPSNTLKGNSITNNDNSGAYLYSSSHNVLSRNDLVDNYYGIVFEQSSNNTSSGNSITNNQYGMVLFKASNNSNYHNNFMFNVEQVYINESTNVWDFGYPSGGNYWSDYNGIDLSSGLYQNETGNDGIGDAAYVVNASDTDPYPLVGMFHSFNVDSEHSVQTICNSTISGFQFNGTAISFNVTGEDGNTGFCRISIPTDLMNGNYTVFVNGIEVPHILLPISNSAHSYLYITYNHSTHKIVILRA